MAHRKARSPRARGYRSEWAEDHRHRQRRGCQAPGAVTSPPARRRPLLLRNILRKLISAHYNLVTRRVEARYPMLTVVFWQTAFGAMFFVPVAYVEDGSGLV